MSAYIAEQEDESPDDSDDADDTQQTESLQERDTDNVGDASVEINVEELLHELEADGLIEDCRSEHAAKRRLEDLMEMRRSRKDLEDFDDYDV